MYMAEQKRLLEEAAQRELEEEEERQWLETQEKRAKHKQDLLWAKRAKDAANAVARSRALQVGCDWRCLCVCVCVCVGACASACVCA